MLLLFFLLIKYIVNNKLQNLKDATNEIENRIINIFFKKIHNKQFTLYNKLKKTGNNNGLKEKAIILIKPKIVVGKKKGGTLIK